MRKWRVSTFGLRQRRDRYLIQPAHEQPVSLARAGIGCVNQKGAVRRYGGGPENVMPGGGWMANLAIARESIGRWGFNIHTPTAARIAVASAEGRHGARLADEGTGSRTSLVAVTAPTGVALAVTLSRANARSRADWNRASGSFSRHRATMRSMAVGAAAALRRRRLVVQDRVQRLDARPAIECAPRLSTARRGWRRAANRSARPSVGWPRICSGAM